MAQSQVISRDLSYQDPMTRINAGIPPSQLSDKHLLAEHREIKRVPNSVKSGRAVIKDIPENFTLGKGHVKFFYDKLLYLLNRYREIHDECIRRGFNVQYYGAAWCDIRDDLMNDYTPTEEARNLILERINLRAMG